MDADDRLHLTRELLREFRAERVVYLVLVVLSFLVLIGAVGRMLLAEKPNYPSILSAFGSSGVVALAVGRVLAMWNQAWAFVTGAKSPTGRRGAR